MEKFEIVLIANVEKDFKMIHTCFVLTFKKQKDDLYLNRARLTVGVHKDLDNENIVHSATTLQQAYFCLLLALAANFIFDIYLNDVTQNYLHLASELKQELFV